MSISLVKTYYALYYTVTVITVVYFMLEILTIQSSIKADRLGGRAR